MRPETKGRVVVGLIVSFLAFGLGTGTAIFSGYNNYSINLTKTNITPPGELPPIFTTPNNTTTNTNQNTPINVQSNPSTNSGNDNLENPSNQSSITPTPNQTENQSQTP